ncbi:hydroxymethylglutaryl-CoA synthase [Lentilactobacillus sp. SPB1-3]|uniref:Hydroxymethylglutaryl-CoA synthase n=1 Tax=Lentilactobacillus terminaliae TaxID=3003483 RepID=A0ACD5DDF7_9LACO|nr:hydroxymethylglutaryl-CoA synthase [Lentilactobacillus sp. SPB1-3]MCZ0977328.1 hydroxymethylglutaryl-CoA synthase [Lentilactobacillus sp. SPB1-3]
MSVGIEKVGFYTAPYYIDMVDLAKARQQDPNKFLVGIGQKQQSVIPPSQDVVSMAANAATNILSDEDKQLIDMIIFGTETGIDNSKAASMYLQSLLGISDNARAFEIKQACYGATAGLQMAIDYITLHPDRKVIVVGADIARYGLNTSGEVTQGGGAVVMLISNQPKIIQFDGRSTFYSKNVMDFWRPGYTKEAKVDGHYSNDVYIDFFNRTFKQFLQKFDLTINDFSALTFHVPYPKMGIKALRSVAGEDDPSMESIWHEFHESIIYNSRVGNLYTGSLYLSLISLIANSDTLSAGDRIGMFSYGSGAQGEFFAGILQDFDNSKLKHAVDQIINNRNQLTISEYEAMYKQGLIDAANTANDLSGDSSRFVLKGRSDDKLIYRDQEMNIDF